MNFRLPTVLTVLALGVVPAGCNTGSRHDPNATVAANTSGSGGGGGALGQARFVQGTIGSAGAFAANTTARFTVAIPAGTTRLFVGLENLNLATLDLYAGQPGDPLQVADYDASLLGTGFGGSVALEVDLTSAPGSAYAANGGLLTIAVHATAGSAPADFALATFFEPAAPDAREEDDTVASASAIAKSTIVEGQTLTADDPDHFAVLVDAGDTIDLLLHFPHAMGNLVLDLLDPTGAVIATANQSSTLTNYEGLAPVATITGTHVIRVRGATAVDAAAYLLEVDVAP